MAIKVKLELVNNYEIETITLIEVLLGGPLEGVVLYDLWMSLARNLAFVSSFKKWHLLVLFVMSLFGHTVSQVGVENGQFRLNEDV